MAAPALTRKKAGSRRDRFSVIDGPPCPADPSHGPLLATQSHEPGKTFYCPNIAHFGRPASHPDGAAPPTRAFFGVDEVQW